MSQLEPRHVRLYGPAFRLHDVRDVEAHVRTLLDAKLRELGARLDAAKYDDALTYLVSLCWRLSGLEADRITLRREHRAEILISRNGRSTVQQLGPFPTLRAAEAAVTSWRESLLPVGAFSLVGYREQRPAGAYDPSIGIAFSTYSRRILSARVVDWFRLVLGDNRYAGKPRTLSLDQLLDDRAQAAGSDETFLDLHGPGARADFVDELNRHAYYDPFEERETRSVTDQGGSDRVTAVG